MMAISIQGGSLGRWFEQLCRIRHKSLREVVATNGKRMSSRKLPDRGGVYAFWWVHGHDMLSSDACNRMMSLKGPGGHRVTLIIDDDWLGLPTELPIPLYIGKTAKNIRKRVGQHLTLSKDRLLPLGKNIDKVKAPTTSCQLRAGLEHLFPRKQDTRSLVLDHVGFSFVELHANEHAANRFYLEDMAIGRMRPCLNVDIER